MVVYFARSRISFYYMAHFLYNLEAREAALSRFLFEYSQVVSELHKTIRVDFWCWGEFLPNDTWLSDSSNSGSSSGCIIAFLCYSLFFSLALARALVRVLARQFRRLRVQPPPSLFTYQRPKSPTNDFLSDPECSPPRLATQF